MFFRNLETLERAQDILLGLSKHRSQVFCVEQEEHYGNSAVATIWVSKFFVTRLLDVQKKVPNPIKSCHKHSLGHRCLTVMALKLWCRFGSRFDHPSCIGDSSNKRRGCCFVPAMDSALEYRYKVRSLGRTTDTGKLVTSVDFSELITSFSVSGFV